MNTLIYFLNMLVQQMSIIFYYHHIGKPKRGFFITTTIFASVIAAEYGLSFLFYPKLPMIMQYAIKYLLNFGVYYLLFNGKLLHKLIQHSSFYAIALLCEFLTYSHIKYVFADYPNFDYYLVTNSFEIAAGRLLAADLLLVLLLVTIIAFRFRFRKDEMYTGELKDHTVILLFVLSHFIYLSVYYKLLASSHKDINNFIQLVFQTLLLSLVFVQYYSTRHINSLMQSEQELQMLRSEMDNNYRIYQLADSRFDEISRLRHDIRNQLDAIRRLMDSEDGTAQAESIMDSLCQQLERTEQKVCCKNKMLNSVLCAQLAEERFRQHEVITELSGSCSFLTDSELCILVSDLLELAADSCTDVGGSITLESKNVGDSFTVTASSPAAVTRKGKPAREEPPYCPTIRNICQKYGGSFTRSRSDGVIRHTVTLRSEDPTK